VRQGGSLTSSAFRRYTGLGLDSQSLRLARRLGGVKWLPSPHQAASDIAALAEKIKRREHPPADWSEDWFKKMQKKYRPAPAFEKYSNVGTGTPRLSIGISLYLLGVQQASAIRNVFEMLGLNELPNKQLLPALKELGEVAKHHGDLAFPGIWPHLVDWNLHFGAQPIDKDETTEAFVKQVESWVYTPKLEDAAGSTREKVILRGLHLLREKVGFCKKRGPTWDEVKAKPSTWLANGSSTSRRLPGSRGTKVSTFLASSAGQLESDLYDESDPEYGVEVKEERGKLRNIMNAPWSLYLQMKFVGLGGLQDLYDSIPTSLSKKFGTATWLNWMDRMKHKLYVPIDQSTYDHVPSGTVLDALLEFICVSCTYPGDSERERVSKLIRERSRCGTVKFAGRSWPHKRGILSGLDWTAGMDTVLNIAEYLGMSEAVDVPVPDDEDLCFQGDDTLAGVCSWGQAFDLVDGYMKVFPVNPTKFFLDNGRTEYLRMVVTPTRRFGYYARLAAGIMYANVWSGGAMAPSSIAQHWSLLHSRGAMRDLTQRHCVDDLAGLLRCRKSEARRVLFTPSSVGGLGQEGNCGEGGWLGLQDATRIRIAQREAVATRWDDVPRAAQRHAVRSISSHGGVFANTVNAMAAAKAMAAGVQGYPSTRPNTTFVVADAAQFSRGVSPSDGFMTPAYPKLLVDNTFLPELLRTYLNQRKVSAGGSGSEGHLRLDELFHRAWVGIVEDRFLIWPRKLWFDWCCGQLSVSAGKTWGVAPDLLGTISKDCLSAGILPNGRVTMLKVRTRALELELGSREWRQCERRRLGG